MKEANMNRYQVRKSFVAAACGLALAAVPASPPLAADPPAAAAPAAADLTPLEGRPPTPPLPTDLAAWQKEWMSTHEQRIAWWREARFGMFIHWGVYSVPAGVYKGQESN